ncbi:hypothetical protein EJ066_22220 [Mesorhizobium sp. M9A.F.Ca.ET.002.03.1.2]|nr:hypothetical protein EJ066_22220 [Mesorhizobium sp. M9A.F.Ca.ET.002.03.1.2]
MRLWYLPPYSPDLNPIEQAFVNHQRWKGQRKPEAIALQLSVVST